MDKSKLNIKARYAQYKNLIAAIGMVVVASVVILSLVPGDNSTPKAKTKKNGKFEALLDDAFSKDSQASALNNAQLAISEMKAQISSLTETLNKQNDMLAGNKESMSELEKKVEENAHASIDPPQGSVQFAQNDNALAVANHISDAMPIYQEPEPINHSLNKSGQIHTVSSQYYVGKARPRYKRNARNYVPAGSFAKAVVLGGVDADASVEAPHKNNGAMLFKIISDGVLPNGQHSDLKGCFVTASATGDVSSERAYITLDRLSCAKKGSPIIDKKIEGWVFFAGKVGIKGHVEMRDDKVAKWAFIGKGIESAGNIVGSMQNITTAGAYGVTSFLPSDKVLAAGGASTAAGVGDELSRYYIRRAEQYHPTINIGAGNLTNIVFREGFSLSAEEDDVVKPRLVQAKNSPTDFSQLPESIQQNIPPEVLKSAGVGNAYAFDSHQQG